MTTFSARTTAAIRAYADRKSMTFDAAADRLVGYGLSAIDEHEQLLESLKPVPYSIEYCEATTDDESEPILTDYIKLISLPTLDNARKALCGAVGADEDTEAAIMAAPIGHPLDIGGNYYRITKAATE